MFKNGFSQNIATEILTYNKSLQLKLEAIQKLESIQKLEAIQKQKAIQLKIPYDKKNSFLRQSRLFEY